jgi:hypothetical protein
VNLQFHHIAQLPLPLEDAMKPDIQAQQDTELLYLSQLIESAPGPGVFDIAAAFSLITKRLMYDDKPGMDRFSVSWDADTDYYIVRIGYGQEYFGTTLDGVLSDAIRGLYA